MQRLILKVDEREGNKEFIRHVIAFVNERELEYVILRRPQNSQALNSFDGLLKIEDLDEDQMQAIQQLGKALKASYKMLWLNEDVSEIYTYLDGESLGEQTIWSEGMLVDEVYYFEQSLEVHFGEKQEFINSEDFLNVDKIARRYPFLFFDFDDQVMYATDWFCLPEKMKKEFIDDLGQIQELLMKYDLKLSCGMVGFDANLNLEKLMIETNKVVFQQKLG